MSVHSRIVWAFDFDGTISNLVPDRTSATIDNDCERVLKALAADRTQTVAIVSSRSLEDLKCRVHLEHAVLIGCSGVEWGLPGGGRLSPNGRAHKRLAKARERLWPPLRLFEKIPGVEVEDKTWSASIHFRHVSNGFRSRLARQLEEFRVRHGAAVQFGPEVAEIQFFPEVSKKLAVRFLVTLFAPAEQGRNLVYAGDDENDSQAMQWVLERQGTAYVVGDRLSVPGAHVVPDPAALAHTLRNCFPGISSDALLQAWDAAHA